MAYDSKVQKSHNLENPEILEWRWPIVRSGGHTLPYLTHVFPDFWMYGFPGF